MAIAIKDAKALYQGVQAGMGWDANATLVKRKLTGIIAFVGTSEKIKLEYVIANTSDKVGGLREWAQGCERHFNGRGNAALAQLGAGTSVIIGIEKDGDITVVTHSETKADCKAMDGWSSKFIFPDISVIPFRTLFGYGNGGVPKALTFNEQQQLAKLEGRS